jgi:hypothetical protein
LFFAAFVLLPSFGYAQQVWIRAYENEEDLWESYREEEITLEQYLRLVGIFQLGADSLFLPISDIDELPGGLDSASMADGSERTDLFAVGKSTLRWGGTLPLREQADEEGYFTGRWSSSLLSLFVDSRVSRDGLDGFRKRGLALALPGGQTRMILGNFEPRFGLGLVVGRRDRLLGRTAENRPAGSIWQPRYSFYNGLQLTHAWGMPGRTTVLGSRIESGAQREDIIAANLSLDSVVYNIDFGFTGAAAIVSSRETDRHDGQSGMGVSLSRNAPTYKIFGELAVCHGGGATAALNITRPLNEGRVDLCLWTYDPDYILLSAGGPGHPGRQQAATFIDELAFYSRTAGEQGLLLKTRTPAGKRMAIETVCQIYNDRLAQTKNLEGKLEVTVRLPRNTALSSYVRGRDTRGVDDESRLYCGVRGRARVSDDFGVAWRWECGTARRPNTDVIQSMNLDVSVSFVAGARVRVVPRWRYRDPDLSTAGDSYYYFYLTEGITLAPECRLEVIAVVKKYETPANGNYTDIRVRMSWNR